MPREINQSASSELTSPDYIGLVKFLIEPFLENSTSLRVDCESLASTNKIWLRVAFDSADKGKVFGRGGRNIQAVGVVLKTAAKCANQVLHLDVYNSDRSSGKPRASHSRRERPRRPERK